MRAVALVLFLGGVLAQRIEPNPPEVVTLNDDCSEKSSAFDYHEQFGIKMAANIKQAEEAINFNGSRITGGNQSLIGDVPYMGGVAILLINGFISVCGSSLLSNTKLVTAAHCWWDGRSQAHSFTIVLGWNMLYAGGTRIATRSVNMHNDWHPATSAENDIAIITISSVEFNTRIRPIELPSGSLLNNSFAGAFAQTAGYGLLADIQEWDNWLLNFVELQIMTNKDCSRYWDGIVDAMMCTTGAPGQSTCNGDMGGPLAYKDNGRDVLIGIASFVSQFGCPDGRPAGFTRVGPYVDWIRSWL